MNPSQAIEIWGRLREGLIVSDEENRSLKEWLRTKDNRSLFHSSLILEGELNELLKEHSQSGIVEKRPSPTESLNQQRPSPARHSHKFQWKAVSSIAALVVLTFSLSYMGELFNPSQTETIAKVMHLQGYPIIKRKNVRWPLAESFRLRSGDQIETAEGQELEIKLSDGTLLWLGENSSFELPSDFELTQDLVLASGKLFLDVAKRQIPLKVSMNRMEIEVLGTQFLVQSEPTKETESVQLLAGSIQATLDGTSKVLKPGQELYTEFNSEPILRDTPPLKKLQGRVIFSSKTHLSLSEPDGRIHQLKIRQNTETSAHPLLFGKPPVVGQTITLEMIEGPNLLIDWNPLHNHKKDQE